MANDTLFHPETNPTEHVTADTDELWLEGIPPVLNNRLKSNCRC